jgi:polyisoprenyl-phosphate glycosyltransferase
LTSTLPVLTLVIPCYNEEAILTNTCAKLSSTLASLMVEQLISPASTILFVDDGSKDHTWQLIKIEHLANRLVTGIKLAANAGHQRALLAGMMHAKHYSDCVITLDADLQDDISVIRTFVLRYLEGFEIVYGVRNDRTSDSSFKRNTAALFYRLMNTLGIRLISNHADYRLLNKRALNELSRYGESKLFLRGIIPQIGFKSDIVPYERKRRLAGETKYPLKKMLSFAFEGITSFSVAPIRLIAAIGFTLFLISMLAACYAAFQKLFGNPDAGWTSLIISIWLLGGLQLMAIGIIGEYIGTIFAEVKKRPLYSIDSTLEQIHPIGTTKFTKT